MILPPAPLEHDTLPPSDEPDTEPSMASLERMLELAGTLQSAQRERLVRISSLRPAEIEGSP